MSVEEELRAGSRDTTPDPWGFVNASKAAVKRALQVARFNPDNRAGHVGAKAVLELLNMNGLSLVRMYDSVGQLPRHIQYKTPVFGDVCTVKAKFSVHNADHQVITSFEFEMSWVQDPREKHMDAATRAVYVENKVYAEAMLVAAEKRAEEIQMYGKTAWLTVDNLSLREWHEMPKNSRPME